MFEDSAGAFRAEISAVWPVGSSFGLGKFSYLIRSSPGDSVEKLAAFSTLVLGWLFLLVVEYCFSSRCSPEGSFVGS